MTFTVTFATASHTPCRLSSLCRSGGAHTAVHQPSHLLRHGHGHGCGGLRLRSSNGGDVGNAVMSLHVLATTASSVHAAHDLELAFELKWTSRMGVLVSVLKAMARCVASLSAICGLAITWFFGSVCALTMSRLVMRSIISEFS